jgi:hypothetical protein
MNKDNGRTRLHDHCAVGNLRGAVVVAITWVAMYLVILVVGLSPSSSLFMAMAVHR